MKKVFSEVIFSKEKKGFPSMSGTVKISRQTVKKAFSSESTKKAMKVYKRIITNPQTRKQTIAFIKAAHGKKIRNTSGV